MYGVYHLADSEGLVDFTQPPIHVPARGRMRAFVRSDTWALEHGQPCAVLHVSRGGNILAYVRTAHPPGSHPSLD